MSLHPRTQTGDRLDLHDGSSRSSSYYELDINYSPRKEKLYLQLQSVNKGTVSKDSEHRTLHHIPSSTLPAQQSTRAVTEDIKDKFLEEIMPIYMNYVTSKKKKKEKKPREVPVNYCGFDVNVYGSVRKPAIPQVTEKKPTSPSRDVKTAKECLHTETIDCSGKEIKVSITKRIKRSSSPRAVDPNPITSEAITVLPKKKASKGTGHKEKGKLTTRKVPQTAGDTDETSQNNAGDATPQTTQEGSNDTTEEAVTSSAPSSKPVPPKKVKPETVTVSTQVKPKELRAASGKAKQYDSITEETAEVSTLQGNKNKEMYFILLSQSGFERNKPIKIPISANDVQKRLGIDPDSQKTKGSGKKLRGLSNKEIQTRTEDASVSIQASSITNLSGVKSKRVRKKAEADSDSEEDGGFARKRTKVKRRHITSAYVIPVKEKGTKISTSPETSVELQTVGFEQSSKSNMADFSNTFSSSYYPIRPPLNIQEKPPQDHVKIAVPLPRTSKKITRGISRSTNTENQFFLARRFFLHDHKKTDVSVQVKNGRHIPTDCRTNETVLRAEISFTDLNLDPVVSNYTSPSTKSDTASDLLPPLIRGPCDLVRYYASARAHGGKIQHRPRNSSLMQNTVETTRRKCDDFTRRGGFEVEGIEPPKKIGFGSVEKTNVKTNLCSSHFPVIEIVPEGPNEIDALKEDKLEVARTVILESPRKPSETPTKEALGFQGTGKQCFTGKTLETIEEDTPKVVGKRKGRFKKNKLRCPRRFVAPKWRSYLFQLSRRRKQYIYAHIASLLHAVPSPLLSSQKLKSSHKNLSRIAEESPSTDGDKKGLVHARKDIVKSMKKADVHLAQTIEKILQMADIKSVAKEEVAVKEEIQEKDEKKKKDSERSTKVSLISEVTESRPSSSDETRSHLSEKRVKKKKFKPMIPVKTWKVHNVQAVKNPEGGVTIVRSTRKMQNSTPEEAPPVEGGVIKVKSSTLKSLLGKAQKRSDSTVVAKMGPSMKSTQLVESCGPNSSTSTRKQLASTCLFTKEFRNSKTKLSAFQKRKLYGEYLRKAKTQNHSVHSICQIVVCDEDVPAKKSSTKRSYKQSFPKPRKPELKVVVKESPTRKLAFKKLKNASKSSVLSSKVTTKSTKKTPTPDSKPRTSSTGKITNVSLNRAKLRLRNKSSRRNCYVLMEMFNNKHFEADSTSSVSNKDSYFENFFKRPCERRESYKDSLEDYKSSKTVPTASEILEEASKRLETEVLSNHTRALLDNVEMTDSLMPKTPVKSCDNSVSRGKYTILKKLAKSFSYCDVLKGKVSSIRRICFPPPDTHLESLAVTTEKFSTDSLEKFHQYPPMETGSVPNLKHLEKPIINAEVMARQNVTIVAYNTGVKYDKDTRGDGNTDTAEVNSTLTAEESGYESNKSKNTLKRFFKRKLNFFKSSKLEIAARDPSNDAAVQSSTKTEEVDQSRPSSVENDYLSTEKPSMSKRSSSKQSRSASQYSVASGPRGRSPEATDSCSSFKIKIKKDERSSKKTLMTWADLCHRSPVTQGLLHLCYISKPAIKPATSAAVEPLECHENVCGGKIPCEVSKRANQKYFKSKFFGITKKSGRTSNASQKVDVETSTDFKSKSSSSKLGRTSRSSTKDNFTNCDLKLDGSQREVIMYLENKFKELERKIEQVAKATKSLQDAACMCDQSEFKSKDVATNFKGRGGSENATKGTSVDLSTEIEQETPKKLTQNENATRSTSVDQNTKMTQETPKKLSQCEGTDTYCERVSKEINTERKQAKKRVKIKETPSGCLYSLIHKATWTQNDKTTSTTIKSDMSTYARTEKKPETDIMCPGCYKGTSTEKRPKTKQPKTSSAQMSCPYVPTAHCSCLTDSDNATICCDSKIPLECQKHTSTLAGEEFTPPLFNPKCVCPPHMSKKNRILQKSVAEHAEKESELRKEEKGSKDKSLKFFLGKSGKGDKTKPYARSAGLVANERPTTSSGPPLIIVEEVLERGEQGQVLKKKVSLRALPQKDSDYGGAVPKVKSVSGASNTKDSDYGGAVPKVKSVSGASNTKDSDYGGAVPKVKTVSGADNTNEQFHAQFTDQELFDKLLESYERENSIADRLSQDDEFFEAQLSPLRSKESVDQIVAQVRSEKEKKGKRGRLPKQKDSLTELVPYRSHDHDSLDQLDVILTAEQRVADHQIREMEQDINMMRANEEQAQPKVQFSRESLFKKEKELLSTKNQPRREEPHYADAISVEPKEIGKCFKRGFRPDNIVLIGEPCLQISEKEQRSRVNAEATTSFIDFSERDTPLEFLLGLGFSVDEASNAIKDEDVKNRLNAAITEARVWINRISTTQGTMLYLVAFKTRPKTMRYFLQLVEAIINQRITDAVRLDGFLKLLEKIEEGHVNMVTILGIDKIDDEQNEEDMVKKQLRKLFYDVYRIAEQEAAAHNKQLTKEEIVLLRILAAKYRAGLQPHLELIAKYIGQGLLKNEVQLEAAMIYLARVDTAEVNLRDFEEYCGISCKERSRGRDSKEQKK